MAKATKPKKSKQSKQKSSKISIFKRISLAIRSFLAKITAPIRNSRPWKFLRRTILRSPFRGYFVGSWQELRKVTWPNRRTSWRLTFSVILFSVFFAALISALDYGFDNLAQRIFLQ